MIAAEEAEEAEEADAETATATTTGADSGTDTAALDLPLTLAGIAPNTVAPLGTVAQLHGTGTPGHAVEARVQHIDLAGLPRLLPVAEPEVLVGTARVDATGLWRLTPDPRLRAGQNVISLRLVDGDGVLSAVISPVVVNVLASGEVGPLALVTPRIRTPAVGSRLVGDTPTFEGSGLPGIQVRLYLNNRLAGEAYVNTREEWQITPAGPLDPGAYVARVAALNPLGEIMAESAPVAFLVEESPLGRQFVPAAQPAIPLDVARILPPPAWGGAMILVGTATPHSSVAVLLDGSPRRFANVRADGSWRLALDFWAALDVDAGADAGSEADAPPVLTVVTDLGEAVTVGNHVRMGAEPRFAPIVVAPSPGVLLTTDAALLAGLARPGSRVQIAINGVVVARVMVDALGQWAYGPAMLAEGVQVIDVAALAVDGSVAAVTTVEVEVAGTESP